MVVDRIADFRPAQDINEDFFLADPLASGESGFEARTSCRLSLRSASRGTRGDASSMCSDGKEEV